MWKDDFFEDDIEDSPWFSQLKAKKELLELPFLSVTQSFCCEQCGEETKPLHYKNVYQRIHNIETGEVTENSIMIYVSKCCLADLTIWDESIEDYLEIAVEEQSID